MADSSDDRTPTGERVAEVLRQRIAEGHLLPGAQLKDVGLSAEFGVARHTLRSALRLLEYDGLVVHQMHKGVVVKTLSTADVQEIYRVRRVLELGGIDNSSVASQSALDDVDAAVRATELAVERKEWKSGGTEALRFHQALVALLGSRSIDQFFLGVLAQLRLAFAIMADEGAWQEPWVARDREICELIRGGRRDSAKALLSQYLDESERAVLDGVRANEIQRLRPARRGRSREA